jgi:hypothetical protein
MTSTSRAQRRVSRRALLLLSLFPVPAAALQAQLISIRTVPVAQGDQFEIFPSHNLGMGGVSIALDDTLLDPFSNPATGSRLGAARLFGSPALYSVSNDAGGGRTLPIGAFLRTGRWYGGVSVALQEVDGSRRTTPPVFIARPTTDLSIVPEEPPVRLDERSHGNAYGFALLGATAPESRMSVGGSLSWADLNAVDGVDLLYAGSQSIRQSGHALDLRLGILKEWATGRSLQAVALHNRFRMAHDVTYLDFFWDPATQQQLTRPRLERNLDYTDTWGLHLKYERPLTSTGWRIGWLATANRMSHPKIPNYEIVNIPRDPGHSSAFNVGVGLSRVVGPARFGVDAIYEPIWSTTWAEAASATATVLGDTIPPGGRTIENDFRFSNALIRLGVGRDLEVAGLENVFSLQLGLVVRAIRYRLWQYDNVQVSSRTQEERWVEWTPTWGLSLRFPELEIRYRGRVTQGTGRPGVGQGGDVRAADSPLQVASGILVAPSGPLSLAEVSVVTHQVSLSLPLR